MVIRMGDDDRIHGKNRGTEKAGQGQDDQRIDKAAKDEQPVGCQCEDGNRDQHKPAVQLVGGDAHGDLRQGAGQNGDTGKKGDVTELQPDPRRIDRRKGSEGRVGNADHRHGDKGNGRVVPQTPQVQRYAGQGLWRGGRRHGCRQQRQAIDHRRNNKEKIAAGVAEGQNHLPRSGRCQIDHRIDAEDAAARGGIGAFIEPAFDNHGSTGKTKSRQGPHRNPNPGLDEDQRQENGDGRQRAHGAKGPDMADTRHKGRGAQATGDIADRPTGSQETQRSSRKAFGFTSDRQDQAVDATGKQQKRRSHQKCSKRQNTLHHGFKILSSWGPDIRRSPTVENASMCAALPNPLPRGVELCRFIEEVRWLGPIKPRGMLRCRLYAIAPACCKYVGRKCGWVFRHWPRGLASKA